MAIPNAPLPPSLSGQPPMGSSPMGMKLGQPGNNAAAVAKLLQAVKIMEAALPELPTGTPIYKATLSAITSISKHAPEAEAQPGIQKTALRDLQQTQQQQAPMEALMRMMKAGGAPGAQAGAQ